MTYVTTGKTFLEEVLSTYVIDFFGFDVMFSAEEGGGGGRRSRELSSLPGMTGSGV